MNTHYGHFVSPLAGTGTDGDAWKSTIARDITFTADGQSVEDTYDMDGSTYGVIPTLLIIRVDGDQALLDAVAAMPEVVELFREALPPQEVI